MCAAFATKRRPNIVDVLKALVFGTYELLEDTPDNRRAAKETVVEQERFLDERRIPKVGS